MTDNLQELSDLRKRHRAILDGRESHGDGTQQEQATRFWVEHLAEPIISMAREKLQQTGKLPKVDLLVSVAGFSPETTIITAGVFRPEQILVISSERTYELINVIGDFVQKLGLRHSQFRHESSNPADLSLFEIVCRRVRMHQQQRAARGSATSDTETLIDITGGKKVMSAGAAMAAGELDLRICYVDNKYDEGRRVAVTGTEDIVILDSPYLLYGGAELRRADHDFDMGAYDVARDRYARLADRLNEPARARFLRDLSSFYNAWRNLDIISIQDALPKIQGRMSEPTPIAREYRGKLEAQVAFVKRLVAEQRSARIMTLFLLGEANMEARRYDFSALLFYRTIEASISSRLEERFPGFLCEKPDYSKIDEDAKALTARYLAAAEEVFGKADDDGEDVAGARRTGLPREVACLAGALLLRATGDELLGKASLGIPKAIANLGNVTTARNRSILAHGYQSVDEKSCKQLRAPAQKLLAAYWTLHGEPMPFEEATQELRFLRLGT